MVLEITLRVNDAAHRLSVDTRTPFRNALRERLRRTGAKKSCNHGQCGACTILLAGWRVNSCLGLTVAQQGAEAVTIEGLANAQALHPLQQALIAHDAFMHDALMMPSTAATARRDSSAQQSGCSSRRKPAGRARSLPSWMLRRLC